MKRIDILIVVFIAYSLAATSDQLVVKSREGFSSASSMEAWQIYLKYANSHTCNCFLWDFYKVNPEFKQISDKERIERITECVKSTLTKDNEGITHKTIILLFEYKGYIYALLDLSFDDLHLSLGQKEICFALYPKGTVMMVFDEKYEWAASFGS